MKDQGPPLFKNGRSLWDLCEAFIQHCAALRLAQAGHTRRLLRLHVMPASIARLPAHVIEPEHVAELLQEVAGHKGLTEASALQARIRQAFEFGLQRREELDPLDAENQPFRFAAFDTLVANPVSAVSTVRAAASLQPTPLLCETELTHVLHALHDGLTGHPAHALGCRILLLNLGLGMQSGAPLLAVALNRIQRSGNCEIELHLGRRDGRGIHVVPVCGTSVDHLEWFERRSRAAGSPWLFAHSDPSRVIAQEIMYRATRLLSRDLVSRRLLPSPFSVLCLRRSTEHLLRSNGYSKVEVDSLQGRMVDIRERKLLSFDKGRVLQQWQDWLSRIQGRTRVRRGQRHL